MLKAKQAGNSQFDFLRFDHYLNPYYKHVLRAMKEGRYQLAPGGQQQLPQGDFLSSDPRTSRSDHRAHPTFLPQTRSRTTPTPTETAVTSTPAYSPPRRAPGWRSWSR